MRTGYIGLVLVWLAGADVGPLRAHPFLQNSWWVMVETNRLVMRVSATLREVAVTQGLGGSDQAVPLDRLMTALSRHGDHMVEALRVEADGRPLTGELLDYQLRAEGSALVPEDSPLFPDETHATFDLEYPLGAGGPPAELQFGHRTLSRFEYAPGIPWEVTYRLVVKDAASRDLAAGLVRADLPYSLELAPAVAAMPESPPRHETAVMDTFDPSTAAVPFGAYLRLGVDHIVTGYDHLLFLAALALAAATLGDFLKLIAAFTVAHSITVTLAALEVVRIPAWFVEPFIAASIVFVAVENLVSPRRVSAPSRLAVAFGFGLIHGLGFARGLGESLGSTGGGAKALAIAAFCLGVELGHVALGLPFWGLLRAGTAEFGDRFGLRCQRWGSVLIAVGGTWFFVAALREFL